MGLIEKTLYGTVNKVKESIKLIQETCQDKEIEVGFSGGKDSIVLKRIMKMSGVPCKFKYNVTTIDIPPVPIFIRKYHPDVIWDRPEKPFLKELIYRGFPLRQRRWCCEQYKERTGHGKTVVLGIRKAESSQRSKRKIIEFCYKDPTKRFVNPIFFWSHEDIWEFIRSENMPYCHLYDCGYDRLGCLMCPMAKPESRIREYYEYPRWAEAFRKAFVALYIKKKEEGKTSVDRWKDGSEMFIWWLFEAK